MSEKYRVQLVQGAMIGKHSDYHKVNNSRKGDSVVGSRKSISKEDIERRAFQIYMARDRENGHDLADWLAAERELTKKCKRV